MSVGYLVTMAKVETMREALDDLLGHFFEHDVAIDADGAEFPRCPACGSLSCDRWAFVRTILKRDGDA